MKRLILPLITLAILQYAGCKKRDDKKFFTKSGSPLGISTLRIGGVDGCVVYTPTAYTDSRTYPLLITYHGNGSKAPHMINFWAEAAEEKGFIVCSVPHLGAYSVFEIARTAGRTASIRDQLFGMYGIDPQACYLNGYSSGGAAAFWAALDSPGWAGLICFTSMPFNIDPWPNASGQLPIYWKIEEEDPFFALDDVEIRVEIAVANNHNVNFITVPGDTHALGIQNPEEAWDWVTDPANRP